MLNTVNRWCSTCNAFGHVVWSGLVQPAFVMTYDPQRMKFILKIAVWVQIVVDRATHMHTHTHTRTHTRTHTHTHTLPLPK